MIEIERKFLVNSDAFKTEAYTSYTIKQGFLNSNKARTVRVRLKDDKGYLTVKGKSTANGLSRFEWEKEISQSDVEALLPLCEPGIIDKTRYEVKSKDHIFEVDEFYGDNEGLVIAEVELRSESENFEKPNWLGKEVTGDIKYYNSQLSKKPYKKW
ncbi:CYTH domain-containing protein [Winogradskyella thalassocola]|uniref:CYTH domain-containing protein n=1 Tax=Winogradskyella thalassocola TaxID=262004 RepID=A0A1G7XAS2_9FLAO|nr:CYTH domain-containing protein [Winogradskyella thalassocola]SDG81286.1 CYTH domain-containing protein [Winogradskyella thalassocola]